MGPKAPSEWKPKQGVDQSKAAKLSAGVLGQNAYKELLKKRKKPSN